MKETKIIHDALEEANLDELSLRLYLYTRKRLSRMFWRGRREGPIPGGWEIGDFVQAAIKKALNQDRIWKSEEKTLFEFLRDIISSDINHLAERVENKIECRVTTNSEETDNNSPDMDNLQADPLDWPDTNLLKEQEDKERELIQAQVSDDPIDQAIVKVILEENLSRPAEIAAELGIPVEEVYNAKRRLRRKYEFLKQQTINVNW